MTDNSRIEQLRRRVQLDPASVAFAGLAEEYRKAGRLAEAVATCRAGLRRHPAYVSARVTLGRSLLALGRLDEARDELEQVIRVAPENLAAVRALGEIHDAPGDRAESSQISALARSDSAGSMPIKASRPEPALVQPTQPSASLDRDFESRTAEPIRPARLPIQDEQPTNLDSRVLADLDAFLARIVRAREALGHSGSSRH